VAANKTIFVEADVAKKMVAPGKFTNEGRESMANAYNAFKKGK
jgi:putrescine transport system substrate-binding protein